MTSKKLIHGYLDKLARNIQALDVGIESARKAAKGEKAVDRRARLKLLRDLIELQNASMAAVKRHLLGADETGSTNEPEDHYDEYAVWEFERDFKKFLEPWTQKDIEFECADCGVESDEVTEYTVSHPYPQKDEHFYLCDRCYEKRIAKDERTDEPESSKPISNVDVTSEDSGQESAITGGVQNTIRLVRMGGESPAEKIKTLEDFKASVCQSAKNSHSEHVLAPGLVMLDMEIQRLRAEAGKGQDAAGKPVE